MRRSLFALVAAALLAAACTNQSAGPGPRPSPPEAQEPDRETATEIEIYAAVIRRLVTVDHTFGDAASPFGHVYVVNRPSRTGESRLRIPPNRPPESFAQELTDGIEERLVDLPPLGFISNPDRVRRGANLMGGVRNRGVIITLGLIRRKGGTVHVPNGLWCGGLCGQWLTYVLRHDHGRWKITGTTGPAVIS